jgi:hypothetical protein
VGIAGERVSSRNAQHRTDLPSRTWSAKVDAPGPSVPRLDAFFTLARRPSSRATLEPMGSDVRRSWVFQQALRRVDPVDDVVADYATSICGRPVRRREVAPDADHGDIGTVTWTIDGDVVVEFTAVAHGRDRVAVHDIGLLRPLRQRLRSRHLVVAYESR